MRRLMTVCVLLVSATAWGQILPPPTFDVQGLIILPGYDLEAVMPCDLAVQDGSPKNNGIVVEYDTVPGSVVFFPQFNAWKARVRVCDDEGDVILPSTAYFYPEVLGTQPDPTHAWYDTSGVTRLDLGTGIVFCLGYDGRLRVAGDLYGNVADDGVLFGRPVGSSARPAHLLEPGIIHTTVDLASNAQGLPETVWAVYPTLNCGVLIQ